MVHFRDAVIPPGEMTRTGRQMAHAGPGAGQTVGLCCCIHAECRRGETGLRVALLDSEADGRHVARIGFD